MIYCGNKIHFDFLNIKKVLLNVFFDMDTILIECVIFFMRYNNYFKKFFRTYIHFPTAVSLAIGHCWYNKITKSAVSLSEILLR